MPSATLPFQTMENRHIPEDATDLIHSLSRLIVMGMTPDEDKPRRMITLEDEGVLKVFSEYENGFDEPSIRLKFFFTEDATKVSIKATYTALDRVTQIHAAVSARNIIDIDIAEVSDLIRLELWGPEDDDEDEHDDEYYFSVDD